MKLKCVCFSQPVTIGAPKTFLQDKDYDLKLNGNFIEIKALREKDDKGVLLSIVATIFNVIYYKPHETEDKKLKNSL